MSIVKGGNTPITITFDEDVSALNSLIVSLWNPRNNITPIKVWHKADLLIDGAVVDCPFSESESAALPDNSLVLEAKGLDSGGNVVLFDRVPLSVTDRYDKKL